MPGRLSEAIPLFEQTIKHMDRVLGPLHLHTLATRNNLAGTFQEAGRIDDAVALHEQVVEAMKAKVGPDDINTLSCINNLANDYRSAGRTAIALDLHEDTLKRMKATLGPDHPNLLNCMSNLAIDYADLGRIADSIALQEQALSAEAGEPRSRAPRHAEDAGQPGFCLSQRGPKRPGHQLCKKRRSGSRSGRWAPTIIKRSCS